MQLTDRRQRSVRANHKIDERSALRGYTFCGKAYLNFVSFDFKSTRGAVKQLVCVFL